MKEQEEAQFVERLTKRFVLVPRDRFYHFIGGAIAVLVLAVGINVASVLTFLKSSTVAKTEAEVLAMKDHVEAMKVEVEKHLAALGAGAYVRADERYWIQTEDGEFGLFVSNGKPSNGADVVIAKGRSWNWKLVRNPR